MSPAVLPFPAFPRLRAPFLALAAAVVACLPAEAKRAPAPKVDPVVVEGVRFSAPNDQGRRGYLVARDARTDAFLGEITLFETPIAAALEEDVQWVFIRKLQALDGAVVATTEGNRRYAVDPRSRVVSELAAAAAVPAGSGDGGKTDHAGGGDFVPLFNGRDLSGWINVNCAPGTWSATNGMIFCTGAPIGELRTTRMYQNFVLELEWRHLKPKGNSGVFVWADSLTARGQPFIRALEVQVLDGLEGPGYTSDGDIFPIHGAKMIPVNPRGGDRAFPTEKRMKPSPEWNHYRIECIDGAISLAVNGAIVTRGHDASPRKGYICLESEGSPIEYRNLRIRELPAHVALRPDDIADPDEAFRPLYTGLNLDGWEAGPTTTNTWVVNDWNLDARPNPQAQPLAAVGRFGDGLLVFDWRWADSKHPGDWTRLVSLRGLDLGPLLAEAAKAVEGGKVELPVGQWNRALLRLRGNRFSAQVNGHELGPGLELPPGTPPTGRLVLNPPQVEMQFANFFWKSLD